MGMPDVSALGAAYLAGLKTGFFKDIDYLKTLHPETGTHHPSVDKRMFLRLTKGGKKVFYEIETIDFHLPAGCRQYHINGTVVH